MRIGEYPRRVVGGDLPALTAQLLVVKSGQPWEKFHHALSTKRELVPSHPVTAAAMVAQECVRREIIEP